MPHEKQKIHLYSGEETIGKDIPKTITETSEPKSFLPEPEITRNLNNTRPPLTKHRTIEIVVQSIKQCSLKYIEKNTSPQCAEKRWDNFILCPLLEIVNADLHGKGLHKTPHYTSLIKNFRNLTWKPLFFFQLLPVNTHQNKYSLEHILGNTSERHR